MMQGFQPGLDLGERNKCYPNENKVFIQSGYRMGVSHPHLGLVQRQAEEWEKGKITSMFCLEADVMGKLEVAFS